ncbi:MAG TPA: hypothetical protein VND15_01655 [Candidatus Acidoferrales bacterium]|nr:hypothetical protein [Candidatus Acidoferrales bacterium]
MATYLLLMYNKEMKMPKNPTKAQMEAGIKPWRDYLGPLAKRGVLASSAPTHREGKAIMSTGVKAYKPDKIDIAGYMLIKAKSMADALKIAKASPHAKSKMGSTVIRECVEMEM